MLRMIARSSHVFCHAVQAFGHCRRGSILPMVALLGTVLLGATGLALDGGRLMLMNSTLQSAIDAGGLSAVAKMSTSEVTNVVRRFAQSNFANGYVSADITSLNTVLNADKTKLTVTATAETSTIFMKIFGIPKLTATATSEITRQMGGFEIALVLDVTGSMNDYGKLPALKSAAKELLNIVFGTDTNAKNLYVGVVPFSQTVNLGRAHNSWMTSTPNGWGGCPEARFNGLDKTDDPPSVKQFTPQMSGACPVAMTPLTSSKSIVMDAVDKLTAIGSTHVNIGAVWGWRMLSPRWRGAWGGEMGSKLPLDYGTEGMTKAVVLMTDGENQWSDPGAYGESTSKDALVRCNGGFFGFCKQTTYWTDERLGVTAVGDEAFRIATAAALDARLTEVCKKMKNAGVKVYTVAFGSPGPLIEKRLRECASLDSLFFNSPTAADLKVAFRTIGDSLSNLRVSR